MRLGRIAFTDSNCSQSSTSHLNIMCKFIMTLNPEISGSTMSIVLWLASHTIFSRGIEYYSKAYMLPECSGTPTSHLKPFQFWLHPAAPASLQPCRAACISEFYRWLLLENLLQKPRTWGFYSGLSALHRISSHLLL